MEHESEIQGLLKVKEQNNEYLKQLYREAYQTGATYHLTKNKAEEMEHKITEVRRKFKVMYLHCLLNYRQKSI